MKTFTWAYSAVAAIAVALSASTFGIAEAQEQAALSVPFTIDITIPFTVEAGESFQSAAAAFCKRNNLGQEQIVPLSNALQTEFTRIQVRNQIARCFKWQRRYAVAPMKSWGSMPDNLRIQWLEMQCDNVVPVDPPVPMASISVEMNGVQIPLMLYQDEDINEVIAEFCTAHGIDVVEYGAALRKGLEDQMALETERKTTQKQVDERQQEGYQRGTFLFAIPINVDGREVKLNVHEGDELGPLVETFCENNGISLAEYGDMLKKSVMDTLVNLQQQLLNELNKPAAKEETQQQQQQQQRAVVVSVPINIDGKTINLELYEGDVLATRVSEFCREHGIKEEDYGQALRNAVLQMYRNYQAAQQQQPPLQQQ